MMLLRSKGHTAGSGLNLQALLLHHCLSKLFLLTNSALETGSRNRLQFGLRFPVTFQGPERDSQPVGVVTPKSPWETAYLQPPGQKTQLPSCVSGSPATSSDAVRDTMTEASTEIQGRELDFQRRTNSKLL